MNKQAQFLTIFGIVAVVVGSLTFMGLAWAYYDITHSPQTDGLFYIDDENIITEINEMWLYSERENMEDLRCLHYSGAEIDGIRTPTITERTEFSIQSYGCKQSEIKIHTHKRGSCSFSPQDYFSWGHSKLKFNGLMCNSKYIFIQEYNQFDQAIEEQQKIYLN